ncbi:CCHC-type domain-containing protein [Entamoeba marina]
MSRNSNYHKSILKKEFCKNCGSSKHKTSDCLERPRRTRAKYTENNDTSDVKIKLVNSEKLDEYIDELKKQTEEYLFPMKVIENDCKKEEFLTTEDEEIMVKDAVDKKRMAVKNLRRRDDIAPYLKNLDGGDAKIQREIDDMENMWDDEEEVTKNPFEFQPAKSKEEN